MNVHIVVTEQDVRKGRKLCPERCPIARAITRATGMHCKVGVTRAHLYTKTGEVVRADIPGAIQGAIVRFDRTGYMELLEFDLEFEKCNAIS